MAVKVINTFYLHDTEIMEDDDVYLLGEWDGWEHSIKMDYNSGEHKYILNPKRVVPYFDDITKYVGRTCQYKFKIVNNKTGKVCWKCNECVQTIHNDGWNKNNILHVIAGSNNLHILMI